MPTTQRRRSKAERGTTLLEAMIALTVLLVGLLGMAQLQIYGVGTTQGARAQTTATQLALELAHGLALLPHDDGRLSGAAGSTPDTPPATFGYLLPLGVPTTGVHEYDDDAPIHGTRLDANLERDPEDPTRPVFRRRWTVWDVGVTATGAAARIVAVSVIWRERTVARPREIVLYVHTELRGSFMANINAFN